MGDYEDYAFVSHGRKRREVVRDLYAPKRARDVMRELKMHFSTTSKVLKQLRCRGIVESYERHGKRYFRLTDKGEVVRRVLLS
jgi:predicted transcriptional regulator